jgi:N-acetyl-gamma-glutamyl-phosphate reductase
LVAEGHDVVFLCGEQWMAQRWMDRYNADAATHQVRIIDLTGAFRNGEYNMVYGFPEFNRKALVRGATRTSIPSAVASAVELALFPLAKNGLLSGEVRATVSIANTTLHTNDDAGLHTPSHISDSTRLDPIAPIENRPDTDAAEREVLMLLRQAQMSFRGNVALKLSRDTAMSRGIVARVEVSCDTSKQEVKRMFGEAYSDHNFTYLVGHIPTVADVANTNKCLIAVEYPHSHEYAFGRPQLHITAVIDNLLKGSAGTAVHCMNLLFGLSERTGLSLKASAF